MSWLQLHLSAAQDDIDRYEGALLACGALSVTVRGADTEEALLEPAPGATPLWARATLVGLFDAATDPQRVKQVLQQTLNDPLADLSVENLADREWTRCWLERFQPMAFGTRLWVCPQDLEPPAAAAAGVIVRLDPGLAFGTGTHPTTALCLRWLDRHLAAGSSLIDYGCGSGILAIAARLLGARPVWAVDHDPQALQACADNAAKNAIEADLQVVQPDALPALEADVVIANILAAPLIDLADSLAARVRDGGHIVLSGLLSDQILAVQAAYAPWFVFEPAAQHDGWACLSGRRRATTG